MKKAKKVKEIPNLRKPMHMNPILLALDISSVRTGYCVGDLDGKLRHVTGSILPDPAIAKLARKEKKTLAEYHADTFNSITDEIIDIFEKHHCDFVIAEALPYVRNVKATITLAMLHGCILCKLKERFCVDVLYLNVPQIRSLIGIQKKLKGTRDEKKEQIQAFITQQGIKTANTDESDSAAVLLAARSYFGGKHE